MKTVLKPTDVITQSQLTKKKWFETPEMVGKHISKVFRCFFVGWVGLDL